MIAMADSNPPTARENALLLIKAITGAIARGCIHRDAAGNALRTPLEVLNVLRAEEGVFRAGTIGGETSDVEMLVAEIVRLRHSNAVLEAELFKLRAEQLQLTMQLEIAQHNRRLDEDTSPRAGSLYFRKLEDGHEVVVYPMLGNRARLCLGDGDVSIVDAFCYDSPARAIEAAQTWDGTTDPLDGWTKNPITGRRRPGGDPAKEHRDGGEAP